MANVFSSGRLATMDAGSLSPGVDIMAILESGTVSGANIQALRDRKAATDVTKSLGVASPAGTVGGATPGAPGPGGVTPAAATALGGAGQAAFNPANFITPQLRQQYMAAGPAGIAALAQVEALQDSVIARQQAQKARTWDSIGAAGLALKDLSIADQDVALTRMASDSEGDPIAMGLLNQLGKIKDKDQRSIMWDRIINQAQGASEAIKNQIAATNAAAQTVSAAAQAASVPVKARQAETAAGQLALEQKIDKEAMQRVGITEQLSNVSEAAQETNKTSNESMQVLSYLDQQLGMLRQFEAAEKDPLNMGVLGALAVKGAQLHPDLGRLIEAAAGTPSADLLQRMRTSFNNSTLAKTQTLKGSISNRDLILAADASANAMSSDTGVAISQLEDQRDIVTSVMGAAQAESNAAQQALRTSEQSDLDKYYDTRNKRIDANINRQQEIQWAQEALDAGKSPKAVADLLRSKGIPPSTVGL